MLKQGLSQRLVQKLSPQQIQFIKLLQVTSIEMEMRIQEEMEENPALEEGKDDHVSIEEYLEKGDEAVKPETDGENQPPEEDLQLEDYLQEDEPYDFRTRQQTYSSDEEDKWETPIVQLSSLTDYLYEQVGMFSLDELTAKICIHLIGSLDENGYLTRPLPALQDDLAFRNNLEVSIEQLENALQYIQKLDPPGVGARDLKECLLLQLKRLSINPAVKHAIRIIQDYFEEFTRKHFDKLSQRLHLEEEQLKEAFLVISKLNPKPGDTQSTGKSAYIIPDFILTVTEDEHIEIDLNTRNAPDLKVSPTYRNILKEFVVKQKSKTGSKDVKEAIQFMKAKIDSAQWFIDAVQQRQVTLLKTMHCIAEKQKQFFISEGDEKQLKPMILKDVADVIQMDISTVSRVANSKYVQTDFGIFPLKFFFSEGISTDSGEEVSNREVKKILAELIEAEDKKSPLSDDRLSEILNEKGYNIARRTIAKYREQLHLPVARLRKTL
jgi:RNA polymerase sigma-54 factor